MHAGGRWHRSSKTKRKRIRDEGKVGQAQDQDQDQDDESTRSMADLEYTAVVSPLERLQRRVAGQPLDQPPPALPFPHAGIPLTNGWTKQETVRAERWSSTPSSEDSRSLHMQHLAVLTAIVHRSLLWEDFSRAFRAIGLLFREDVVSHNAAARTHGFMGIAAEVLLRYGCPRDLASDVKPTSLPLTRDGFEKAKRFYERLIIRHPYHKAWPGSVNSVDFYLAMFNLWIYVVHAESTAKAFSDGEDESIVESATSSPRIERSIPQSRTKLRVLEQANEIAARMDTCMATMPYADEPELIRLRAMVALWVADLNEACVRIAAPLDQVRALSDSNASPSSPLFDEDQSSMTRPGQGHEHEAALARDYARGLLSRLEGRPRSEE